MSNVFQGPPTPDAAGIPDDLTDGFAVFVYVAGACCAAFDGDFDDVGVSGSPGVFTVLLIPFVCVLSTSVLFAPTSLLTGLMSSLLGASVNKNVLSLPFNFFAAFVLILSTPITIGNCASSPSRKNPMTIAPGLNWCDDLPTPSIPA